MTKPANNPVYLTVSDLAERWQCGYAKAKAFMHRKGSGAIKIGNRLLVKEKEVINFEETQRVRY